MPGWLLSRTAFGSRTDDAHHLLVLLLTLILDEVETFRLLLFARIALTRIQLQKTKVSCIVLRLKQYRTIKIHLRLGILVSRSKHLTYLGKNIRPVWQQSIRLLKFLLCNIKTPLDPSDSP